MKSTRKSGEDGSKTPVAVWQRAHDGLAALAGLPYEARVVDRSSPWRLDDATTLRTCSAEDLLVMKAFAARDKDWADVTSILERQGLGLDLDLVRRELRPLIEAKEQPEIAAQLERRIERHIGKRA